MDPRLIPPPLVPALSRKRDFGSAPAFSTQWYLVNTGTPPLDRPAVRYALNLATDKAAIVNFLGAGQKPANGIVPPMTGYASSATLPVSIDGRNLNVLAFDPRSARELLRAEGIKDLELSMTFPALPRSKDIASIMQRQWSEHLGVRLNLSEQGETAWFQDMIEKRYRHLTEDSWTARCDDPNDYLALFARRANYSTWVDTKFDRGFTDANAILEPAERMKALAACESQLMKAMPVHPNLSRYLGLPRGPLSPRFEIQSVRLPAVQIRLDRHQLEAVMKPVSRRALLGVSPLVLAACETKRARYFGKTDPPRSQELVYLLGAEPGTLDPAKSGDLWEAPIIHAMFEGLTSYRACNRRAEGRACYALRSGLQWTSIRVPAAWPPPSTRYSTPPRPKAQEFRPAGATAGRSPRMTSCTPGDAPSIRLRLPHMLTCFITSRMEKQLPRDGGLRKRLPSTLWMSFRLRSSSNRPFRYLMRLVATRFFFATPQHAIESAARRGAEARGSSQAIWSPAARSRCGSGVHTRESYSPGTRLTTMPVRCRSSTSVSFP